MKTNALDTSMVVVLAALPQELGDSFAGVPVIYTGVGKVNAARVAMKTLLKLKPTLILNFGTAGSPDADIGDIINCTEFVQADMRAEALGCETGETPFERLPYDKRCHYRLKIPNHMKGYQEGRCITQDRFVNMKVRPDFRHPIEVWDMEAYAIAKCCLLEEVPFICMKAISDGGDPEQWEDNAAIAAKQFRSIYDQIVSR